MTKLWIISVDLILTRYVAIDRSNSLSMLTKFQAYPNLMKYARVLLEHCSNDTTMVFVAYYTGKYRPKKDVAVTQIATPEEGYRASAANAVQNLANLLPLPYMNTSAVSTPPTQVNGKATVSDQQIIPQHAEP